MVKKKVTTTTTVTTEIIDDATLKPLRIHVLIDNSGSMSGWQTKVVSSVNEYIQTMKNKAKTEKALMSLGITLFSSGNSWSPLGTPRGFFDSKEILTTLRPSQNINSILPLSVSEIRPDGGTPLLDAVGKIVNYLDFESEKNNEDVVLVVMTDGEENSSTEYKSIVIKDTLKHRQDNKNWLVIYLGANQDAWSVGGSMGVGKWSTATFAMNNMDNALMAVGRSTQTYYSSRNLGASAFTSAEVKSMTGDVDLTKATPKP